MDANCIFYIFHFSFFIFHFGFSYSILSFFPFQLGGAAWFPPLGGVAVFPSPFGCVVILPLFWVELLMLMILRWRLRPSSRWWPPCLRPLWWWSGWLGSTSIIGSNVGYSTLAIVAMSCSTECRQTVRSFAKWKLSSTPNTFALWLYPRATFTDGRHRVKSSSKESGKSVEPPRASLSDWLTSKCVPCLYLDILGSISAPDGTTVTEEAHALQCTTARPYRATPTWPPSCWICVRPWWIRIRSLAARFRKAAKSGTLENGIAKIRAARELDGASI